MLVVNNHHAMPVTGDARLQFIGIRRHAAIHNSGQIYKTEIAAFPLQGMSGFSDMGGDDK